MADHRIEQILSAVTTLVTGLASTGANVERGRVYPWADDQSPALSVSQGVADPVDIQGWSIQTVALEVIITAHVKTSVGQVDSQLNQVNKEVTSALMADRTLGLAFVVDIAWAGNDPPDLDGDSEAVTGRQDFRYTVTFKHSITDPSQ